MLWIPFSYLAWKYMEMALSQMPEARRRRALAAAIFCNALEWYDFAIYGILAVHISAAFFPGDNPTASLLATLAVFGITFVVRPLGALLLGGLADRRGRRPALLVSAALMAAGTFMIGLIPTHHAIGMFAPLLLLLARLLQGFSAGGEWGTANAFLFEWASEGQRGFWTSFLSLTVALGTGLASATAAILVTLLPAQDMANWGWRIPFLLGGVLCLFCLWLRRHMDETPAFTKTAKALERLTQASARPMLRPFLTVFGITIHWTVCYYIFLIYMPIFARSHGGVSPAESVWSNTICTVIIVCLVPVIGRLSDSYGRRPFMMASCVAVVLLTIPAFWLITTAPGFAAIVAIQGLFAIAIAFYSGAAPAAVAEQFATTHRSRWTSVSYAMAAAVFGGFAPFISVWLTERLDSAMAPTIYVLAASTISLLVVQRMCETASMPLDEGTRQFAAA